MKSYNITECPYPCKFQRLRFLKEFSQEQKSGGGIEIILLFDQLIKITTASFSYTELELVAELGGYVGLFLGVSVCNLSKLMEKLVKMLDFDSGKDSNANKKDLRRTKSH